jgi:DNA-binding MarR family transcriptional regulator
VTENPLILRDQVCFALYSAQHAVTGLYRPLLDELGITYPQFLVLLALWEADGRSVSQIGAVLRLDSGTLSPLIKRLEQQGLVERRRDAADERRVRVHLTPDGHRLREQVSDVPRQVAVAAGLTPESLFALRDTLNSITASIHHDQSKD